MSAVVLRATSVATCLLLSACAGSDPRTEVEAARAREAAELRVAYARPQAEWPAPVLAEGVVAEPFAVLPPPPEPAAGPDSDALRTLGELLFFDGRLSGTRQMACASCHVAELGWADGRARSLGHGALPLARNTPSMLNAAHQPLLFWDGRASSLEELVIAVLTNDREMGTSEEQVEAAVAAIAGYAPYFEAAFGDADVSAERIARAVAAHVRTVVSGGRSDFDRFLQGDVTRLSDAALRGLHLFRTEAGCLNCHSGPLLSDGRFHNIGLTYYGREDEDLGRQRITGDPSDSGRFRTPSLRNVARTAPYTHTGFFELPGLLEFYAVSGRSAARPPEAEGDPLWPTTSPLLRPFALDTGRRDDLVAFLGSLTEPRRRDVVPALPE